MRNAIKKVVLMLLVLAMCLSVVSCKSTDKKKNPTNSTTSSQNPDETVDPIEDIDVEVDPEILISRPYATGTISTGIKLAYDDSEEWEEIIDEEIEVDNLITNDIDYQPLIMKFGTAVSGSTRNITVQNGNKGIVYTDYDGIGCNIFPTWSTLDSQQKIKTADAYLELIGKRFNDVAPRYARAWFQVDWMVTNDIEEKYNKKHTDYEDDWENNPDYQNYINGIYDFESDEMQSCIEYWKMLEESDTEIYVSFGWKNATRIQNWFAQDVKNAKNAAPNDIDAYARAAAALFKYCRNDVGLTNVNILSFYNEPRTTASGKATGGDFAVNGDKCVYFANVIKRCKEEFAKHKDLKDVIIAGVDQTGKFETLDDSHVHAYIHNHYPDLLDMQTYHRYSNLRESKNPYDYLFDAYTYIVNVYNTAPNYVSEYYCSDTDVVSEDYYDWGTLGWNASTASYFILTANTGMHGLWKWAMVGGYLGDPSYLMLEMWDHQSWGCAVDEETSNKVYNTYYQEALLNTYVKKDSNVHNLSWTGEDIRCSAFTTKDKKDFTLVVEVNEKNAAKNINIQLEKSLNGRDVNIFKYSRQSEGESKPGLKDGGNNGNALVPKKFDTFAEVYESIEFVNNERDYCIYVFTTLEPLKQISLVDPVNTNKTKIYAKVAKNATASFKPIFIDNESEKVSPSTVEWEIKRYSEVAKDKNTKRVNRENVFGANLGEIVSVDKNGVVTYKPASDAKKGDIIALRCTLKSNSDRYAVAMIEII